MKVHTYEKAFLALGATLLIACGAALVYASVAHHVHLPGAEGRIDPKHAYTAPPFNRPGVRQVGPNQYEAVVVAQAWAFVPNELRIPAGADVTFIVTTADVIHGFFIEGTRVNMMLIPGQIARATHRFTTPGEQRLLLCHEYCGAAHHTMSAKVVVTPPTPATPTTVFEAPSAPAPTHSGAMH